VTPHGRYALAAPARPVEKRLDWLAAIDDWITGRWTHCMACGGHPQQLWRGLWDCADGSAIAYSICVPRRRQPGAEAEVGRRLEARYARQP
jgi:hypothetical protein